MIAHVCELKVSMHTILNTIKYLHTCRYRHIPWGLIGSIFVWCICRHRYVPKYLHVWVCACVWSYLCVHVYFNDHIARWFHTHTGRCSCLSQSHRTTTRTGTYIHVHVIFILMHTCGARDIFVWYIWTRMCVHVVFEPKDRV